MLQRMLLIATHTHMMAFLRFFIFSIAFSL